MFMSIVKRVFRDYFLAFHILANLDLIEYELKIKQKIICNICMYGELCWTQGKFENEDLILVNGNRKRISTNVVHRIQIMVSNNVIYRWQCIPFDGITRFAQL